jgi:CheY-like chemotaxis protein
MTGKKVLLLDDECSFGEIFQIMFDRLGAELVHFARVRVEGDNVILMNPTGKESTLNRGDFDFALLDGRIKGGNMNGWDVTPYMVRLGLPVVAISGADSLNEQMLQAGATAAVRKDLLWSQLRDGMFKI